jgi:hypothetical protein
MQRAGSLVLYPESSDQAFRELLSSILEVLLTQAGWGDATTRQDVSFAVETNHSLAEKSEEKWQGKDRKGSISPSIRA